MRIEIEYDQYDHSESAAAWILAEKIQRSEQFDRDLDTLALTPTGKL